MLVPVARASALMEIQRVRKLDIPGEVQVNEGQKVYPQDVIAETSLPAKVAMVEVASSLGIDQTAVKEFLVREPGEVLHQGDVIAQIIGGIPRLVRSPLNGKFAGLHQGKAVFEVDYRTIALQAGMQGVVKAVIPEYGAVLATTGFLLQGVWGNGMIGFGELKVIEAAWTRPMEASMLPAGGEGEVLAAGSCLDAHTLADFGNRAFGGLILGWMSPGLIQVASALPVPVVVVQGLGTGEPDPLLRDWLVPQAGKPVSLDACALDRLTGARPEVIISLEAAEPRDHVLNTRAELRVGQKVRLFSEHAMGSVGEVTALPEGLHLFESGLQLPAGVVQLKNGEKLTVPQQNLVILDDPGA